MSADPIPLDGGLRPGRLGTAHLVFFTVAASAPLTGSQARRLRPPASVWRLITRAGSKAVSPEASRTISTTS